jgi:hypothetical protein
MMAGEVARDVAVFELEHLIVNRLVRRMLPALLLVSAETMAQGPSEPRMLSRPLWH